MRIAFLILLNLPAVFIVSAQENIPIGTWRTHFSYYNTQHVAEAGSRIYASAESGLYFFDKADNSLTKLSKVEGLQDLSISALFFDNTNDQLLIGYHSGNLDVIRDNQVFNLDLTSSSQVSGSKKINHIAKFGDFAYLCTDFGVLKFDLRRLEAQETYRELGWGGTQIQVNQAAVLNNSLFLATEEGVLAGNLTRNINLLDYRNWGRFTTGISNGYVSILGKLDDKLLAGVNNDSLYLYNNGQWEASTILAGANFTAVSAAGQKALLAHSGTMSEISSSLEVTPIQHPLLTEINEGVRDSEGILWIADGKNGLISDYQGTFQSYTPSGPESNRTFRLSSNASTIYALPGGYTSNLDPLFADDGFFQFSNGSWVNSNTANSSNFDFKDITDAEYRHGSVFLASAGYGLLQITENGEQILINENTSPLQNLSTTTKKVIVPAIASSTDGLWVLNYGADQPLHFIANDASWKSYSFNLPQARYALDILVVKDKVWMIVDPAQGGGIVVFDPEREISRYLSELSDNGGLAHANVNTLAMDREGLVWAGTDKGVSVFSNPDGVLQGSINATKPTYEGRWLLSEEKVTTIEIDGGNRKWIGTANGVWLFNDAADQEILNFTSQNSPLPDNLIKDIEINSVTGEVFFATATGITSYRGTATASEPIHGKVRIFPNPVTIEFQGTVGISGLATDAMVKITDISGKLVWQEQANGGTATWNVSDYRGNRAATGIYLVFSASKDGKDAYVGKIAVIN